MIEAVRLPRILAAAVSGAGLAVSGACLQSIMRNPLVGPDLVGVTAGATCGGAFAILFDAPQIVLVSAACMGGLFAFLVATTLSRLIGGGILGLLLSGVIVAGFFSACLALTSILRIQKAG